MAPELLFTIEELVKTRPGDQGYALHIRHLEIRRGAKLAITGPSGCGKSTTLDLLGLALRPDSAKAFIFHAPQGDIDVMALWEGKRYDELAALRLAYMGYVLQSGELLPFLTVRENMVLPARLAGRNGREAEEAADALAERLGIRKRLLGALPATLSVGERQRAAIARALCARPCLILADEPTAALDPANAGRVMAAFLEALGGRDSTLVLVTHDAGWARAGGLAELAFPADGPATGGYTAVLDDSLAAGARSGEGGR